MTDGCWPATQTCLLRLTTRSVVPSAKPDLVGSKPTLDTAFLFEPPSHTTNVPGIAILVFCKVPRTRLGSAMRMAGRGRACLLDGQNLGCQSDRRSQRRPLELPRYVALRPEPSEHLSSRQRSAAMVDTALWADRLRQKLPARVSALRKARNGVYLERYSRTRMAADRSLNARAPLVVSSSRRHGGSKTEGCDGQ